MTDGGPEFRVVRRGYETSGVDAHLAELALQIESLESDRNRFEQRLLELDAAPRSDVKAEIDAVQTEVGRILQAAREAAEAMRSRSAEDAARWRSDADTESRLRRTTAEQDAEQLRKAAWVTGTEMLEQSVEETSKLIEAARQDSLFIRAESEREALRLTSDARREAEELVRSGRAAVEEMTTEARVEGQRILAEARTSADAAHERARALEERRTKLLEEIESTRSTMGQLERELDARRESLQYAGVEDLPEVTRVDSEPPAKSEVWGEDGGAVRIVTAATFTEPIPVDADELADEVRRLRENSDDEPGQAEEPESVAEDEGIDDVDVEPEAEAPAEPEPIPEPEPAVEISAEAPNEPGPAPEPESPELRALFAQLREAPEAAQPEAISSLEQAPADVDESAISTAVAVASPGVAATMAADPFDVRDRLVLPIENRALRSVKRQLVDLQNRVLEELRVAGGSWEPDASMFTAAFSGDIDQLVREALVAGVAGSAELQGKSTPQPPGISSTDATANFVGGLVSSLQQAHSHAATPGAGVRKVSSAVSKVFRAWRTDEAERRLRSIARGAYHRGVIAGLRDLGVSMVVAVESGTACDDCPARSGLAWGVNSEPPEGSVLPPALSTCACTVVPAG